LVEPETADALGVEPVLGVEAEPFERDVLSWSPPACRGGASVELEAASVEVEPEAEDTLGVEPVRGVDVIAWSPTKAPAC